MHVHPPRCLALFLCKICILIGLFPGRAEAVSGAELPYAVTFDASDGFPSGAFVGNLEWELQQNVIAEITEAGEETEASLLFEGDGWLVFSADSVAGGENASQVIWMQMDLMPVFLPNANGFRADLDVDGNVFVMFDLQNGQGRIALKSGNGFGVADRLDLSVDFPLAPQENVALEPLRLTLRLDYAHARWDLYLKEEPVLFNLVFVNVNPGRFGSLALRGHEDHAAALQEVYVAAQNPLFQDSSGDGIPDSWLISYGLDPLIDQRDLDPDRDGLSNLQEYLLGTNPVNTDTDGDGISDGMELALGLDPLQPDALALGTVPFADGFEEDTPGAFLHGTRLWFPAGGAPEVVESDEAPEGVHYLSGTGEPFGLSRYFHVTQTAAFPEVFVDLHMRVGFREHGEDEMLEGLNRAAAFYVAPDGIVQALDGNGFGGGVWTPMAHPPLQARDWARFTVKLDYPNQRWFLWVNSVRYGQHLGFRDPVPAFSLVQFEDLGGLDGFSVGPQEPADLDNDGDGLTNAEELALGTNPDNPDTSGDGMTDADKVRLGLDPLATDSFFATLLPDGEGGFFWHTEFSALEGHTPGELDGQQDWSAENAEVTALETVRFSDAASAAAFERFFALHPRRQLWLNFRARLQPGPLPAEPFAPGEPVTVAFGYSAPNTLQIWNTDVGGWYPQTLEIDGRDWNEYTLYLDYEARRAALLINGSPVAMDLPHATDLLSTFSRFRILRGAFENADEDGFALDHLTVSTAEPPGLDFSGDGMTNDEKRALGLDPWINDNSGDGLPDIWLIQHGLDPLTKHNPNQDLDGDGLSLMQEYLLGTDPTNPDTDGDGWLDGEEYLAGTDPLDPDSHPDARGYLDWTLTDIGSIQSSSVLTVNDRIAFRASGDGVRTNAQDRLALLHTPIQGDFSITLRIHDFINSHNNAHISLMLRETLQADSALVSLAARGDDRNRQYSTFQRMISAGSTSRLNRNLSDATLPNRYIRMEKQGDLVTLSASNDGMAFTPLWTRVHSVIGPYQLGISLNAATPNGEVRAVLSVEDFRVDSNGDGLWDHEKIAMGLDPLASDTDGDGISDYDEIHYFHSNPLVADIEATPVSVATLQGGAVAASYGTWTIDGDAVYATDNVGALEYTLTLPDIGIYRVSVGIAEQSPHVSAATSLFELRASINGVSMGMRRAHAPYGENTRIHYYLPNLPAGTHTLRLDWVNTRLGTRLRVNSIELERFDGPDTNGSGHADWIDHRIAHAMQPDALPAETLVSPFSLEGNAHIPAMVSGTFHPFSAPEDAQALSIRPGLARRYHTNVPLHAEELTHILLDPEHGLHLIEHHIAWATFNLHDHPEFDLRLNDALLLAASHPDQISTAYDLEVIAPTGQSETFTLTPGEVLEFEFDQTGEWTLHAELALQDQPDPVLLQTLVTVHHAHFPSVPFVILGHTRHWHPDLSGPGVELSHDPVITLAEPNPGLFPRRFRLAASGEGGGIVARLPNQGPILASIRVDAVTNHTREQTANQVVETFPDGSVLVRAYIRLSHVPDDLSVNIRVFKSGVTFEDGTTRRTLTADDFDEFGRYVFHMLRSPGVTGGTCHSISISQAGGAF